MMAEEILQSLGLLQDDTPAVSYAAFFFFV